MIIAGVDPGLSITGYALIELDNEIVRLVEAGAIRSDANQPLEARLLAIHNDFLAILEEFKPERIAVEGLYSHYNHPQTAVVMGHCRGVIFLAAGMKGIEVISLASTRIKKAVTGNGRASKQSVGLSIAQYFNLPGPPSPVDVSDAIACAMTLSNTLNPGNI